MLYQLDVDVPRLVQFGCLFICTTRCHSAFSYNLFLFFGLGVIEMFFLVRIFIIQHDCGHQSFLQSKKLNNLIGLFCSFFSTIPFKYWAKVHNHHHGHTGQLEERNIGDINFITVKEYRSRGKWKRFS